jgi:hypothetical protein
MVAEKDFSTSESGSAALTKRVDFFSDLPEVSKKCTIS